MTNSISRGAKTGLVGVLLIGAQVQAEPYGAQPAYPAQPYPAQSYGAPGYADPAYVDPGYAPQSAYPGYAAPQYPEATYPAPGYDAQGYDAQGYPLTQPDYTSGMPQPSYAYPNPAPADAYDAPAYPADAYPAPAYPESAYDPSAYAQPPVAPEPGYAPPSYDGYSQQGYAVQNQQDYYANPYPYTDPNMGEFSVNPGLRRDGRPLPPMFNSWDELYTTNNPWYDPRDLRGYWADPEFRPWSSGPFSRDKSVWEDGHPMSNMPWGNFPGWADGPFGGFGPESWEGITPWGNDVPFKWIDPTDPRAMVGDIWDDALNTPNRMGRMPPGWTAPYISVPNPIDVEEEFERNARNFPDEMRKAINTGESDWGGSAEPRYRDSKDEKQKRDENKRVQKPKPEEKPWVRPMAPIKPYGEGFSRTPR